MRRFTLLAVLLLSVVALPVRATAQNVRLVVEGALTNSGGGPVSDASYAIAFRLYEAQSTPVDQALFEEPNLGVQVTGSRFVYTIGAAAKYPLPAAIFISGKARWIGLQIGSEPELPRAELQPVGYAVRAEWAALATALQCSGCLDGSQLAPGSVSTANLAAAAVTNEKIAAGAVESMHVGFTYAASDSKGGDALAAKLAQDLACTGCVASDDLADAAATTAKIADGAVSTTKIAAASVATDRIADGAVTKDKVAPTLGADLGLVAKSALHPVALSGAYSALAGAPDLGPYAKLASANTWAGKQTYGTDTDFAANMALNFRFQVADADPASCDASHAGMAYFNAKSQQLLFCGGKTWKQLYSVAPGSSADNPGASCKDILASAPGSKDGTFWIDPDGSGSAKPYQAWCDMTLAGGGWTLVSTKVNVGFVAWSGSDNVTCATSTTSDCASRVPAAMNWSTAMWRFSSATNAYLTYDKTAAPEFTSYLNGANVSNNPTVAGLTKVVDGVTTGPTSVAGFHYYTGNGISEDHGKSDQWLDLWNSQDGSNNYKNWENDSGLWGTKCIASYCKSAPVWLMVR